MRGDVLRLAHFHVLYAAVLVFRQGLLLGLYGGLHSTVRLDAIGSLGIGLCECAAGKEQR
jgi:hypothetical protein